MPPDEDEKSRDQEDDLLQGLAEVRRRKKVDDMWRVARQAEKQPAGNHPPPPPNAPLSPLSSAVKVVPVR